MESVLWLVGIFRCFGFVRQRSRYFMSKNRLPKIRLRESVSARKPTLQIHVTTAKHFVLSFWRPESSTVVLFDSLGMKPTKDLRVQIFKCYETPVTVYMPKLQKQERGSNNCAFFCAAYMTDDVSHQTDGIPEAIYVDGEKQRK